MTKITKTSTNYNVELVDGIYKVEGTLVEDSLYIQSVNLSVIKEDEYIGSMNYYETEESENYQYSVPKAERAVAMDMLDTVINEFKNKR